MGVLLKSTAVSKETKPEIEIDSHLDELLTEALQDIASLPGWKDLVDQTEVLREQLFRAKSHSVKDSQAYWLFSAVDTISRAIAAANAETLSKYSAAEIEAAVALMRKAQQDSK